VLLQEFAERRELHDLRCNHTPNNARAVPHVKRGADRLADPTLDTERAEMR
jgi:hypothetical protein